MLAGLFLKRNEAEQMLTEGEYRGENWLKSSISKTSRIFRDLQNRLEAFLLKTVRWSLGKGKLKRRLIVLALPLLLLLISIQLLPPADYLPEGNRNLILWLAEPHPGTSIPEAIKLSEEARNFVAQQPEVMRTLYVHRPGRRIIAVFVKPELATGNNLDSLVERLRTKSNDYPGYRFLSTH